MRRSYGQDIRRCTSEVPLSVFLPEARRQLKAARRHHTHTKVRKISSPSTGVDDMLLLKILVLRGVEVVLPDHRGREAYLTS